MNPSFSSKFLSLIEIMVGLSMIFVSYVVVKDLGSIPWKYIMTLNEIKSFINCLDFLIMPYIWRASTCSY